MNNCPAGPKHVGIGHRRLHIHLFVADCSQSMTAAAKVPSVLRAAENDANNIW
jgi:hypothetical protein